ncbi:MAG: Xaa-Pro peptidase family protein [Synergistaceae bacterium]|nr:Xaa-Pro peptidase family protein [Synergistaceae bacterium]
MSQDIYSARREKICKYLSEAGFDKALVGEPFTFFYLTGVMLHPYERFMGLVIDARNGQTDAIIPGVDITRMSGSGVSEHVYDDASGPSKLLKKFFSGCKRTGVEMEHYTMKTGEILRNIGLEARDVSGVIGLARLKKDEYEIEQIENAAACADRALASIKGTIKPGVSEKEISLALLCEMSKTPGFIPDPYIIQILTGPRSANPHGISGEARVAYGDVMTIDYCGYYNFYWSDFTRTMFAGEVSDEFRNIYGIVLDAHLAGIDAARPGVPASAVDKAARDVITKSGYGGEFVHRTGHGIGLNVHEPPNIHSGNDELILEENMVFTVEPGIYLEGRGGVRIEDDVCVTGDGCRSLNTYSKRIEDMILPVD